MISNHADIASKCDNVVLMKNGEVIGNDHFKNLKTKDIFYQANIA
jgi:ABC-type uncharacterized transport system ATPase subunit